MYHITLMVGQDPFLVILCSLEKSFREVIFALQCEHSSSSNIRENTFSRKSWKCPKKRRNILFKENMQARELY